MSETLSQQISAEERVFGSAFSLAKNANSDEEAQKAYCEERTAAIKNGETTWLSRTTNDGAITTADLYANGEIEARIIIDHNQNEIISSVHPSKSIDTNLSDIELFEAIVINAEQHAENLA